MPRIDDKKVQSKIFKKKEYRSWDNNIVDKLKIKESAGDKKIPTNNVSSISEAHQISSDKVIQNPNSHLQEIELNKGSKGVHKESQKSSDRVQKGSDKSSIRVQQRFNRGSIEVPENPNERVHLEFITNVKNIRENIVKLTGNEKKLFSIIINMCSIKGSLCTGEIAGGNLNEMIGTTRNGRETALKRLCRKGLVKRQKVRRGVRGALNLMVTEAIKSEALNYFNTHKSQEEILQSLGVIRVHNKGSTGVQLGSDEFVHSSSNININTTNKNDLPDEWLNINIEPLQDIGFSKTQLQQLQSKNLNSSDIVQESINHFAYGLEKNPKFKNYSEPLNVLMGVLRKGNAWIEQGYRSPQVRAQERLLELKKAERERIKKMNEEAYMLALDEWKEELTQKEIEEIAPTNRGKGDIMPQNVKLSNYFKEHIWPEKKPEYIAG